MSLTAPVPRTVPAATKLVKITMEAGFFLTNATSAYLFAFLFVSWLATTGGSRFFYCLQLIDLAMRFDSVIFVLKGTHDVRLWLLHSD